MLPRRMALVDLGWDDADAILRGMGREDLEVRLVLGTGLDEPGVRVARLLGVPHSTDLVDLTRELFDVAVIGASSPRRAALERLIGSLGTEILEHPSSPSVAGRDAGANRPLGQAGAFQALGVESAHALDAVLGPDVGAADHESSPVSIAEAQPSATALGVVPPRPVAEPEPVFHPKSPSAIGSLFEEAPSGAGARDADELARRVALALERHRQEGTRYALHRVTLNASTEQADALAASLRGRFRAGDFVCRAEAASWVLLCSGPSPRDVLGRRVRRVWRRLHPSEPPPVARRESVALVRQADAAEFAAAAREWGDDVGAWAAGDGRGDPGARSR
jgi:hypothetical protein